MSFLALVLTACVPVLSSPKVEDSGGTSTGGYDLPENGWPKTAPPAGLEGQGYAVGDVLEDFRMPDQQWETTTLWQFYGNVILVDISTMWCSPCQAIAVDVQGTADDFRDEGFVYVTVLAQDMGSTPPDQAELNLWADSFGINEPVLSDQDGWYVGAVPSATFPGLMVVGRDMTVVARDIPASDEAIRTAIEAAL